MGTALKAVIDYLSARRPKLTLPLDVAATAFQMRVWRELQKIPLGETRSYEEIAQRLANGAPERALPIYSYPVVPRYSGSGDPRQASSFVPFDPTKK